MCDYFAGQLLLTYHRNDPSAKGLVNAFESEGVRPLENMHQKLEPYGRGVDPRLEREFYLISVPEGDEIWWAQQFNSRYMLGAASTPESFRNAFAVSPNHLLMPCAITFTFDAANHPAYRSILNDKKSTGTGSGVRVKVLDTGLSSSSTVRGGNIVAEVNIVDKTHPTDVEDNEGHGTVISEIIYDLAPKSNFLIYKVKGLGPIIEWDVLAALCDSDSADLINCSFAFGLRTVQCPTCGRQSHSSRSAVFEGTLRQIRTINTKTIIVAAAGNKGASPLLYPARFRETMAIGAIDKSAVISSTSNYGDLDAAGQAHDSLFFAPGGNQAEKVGQTSPGGKTWDGTSFAAAYATGLLAKLQSDPSYSGDASSVLAALYGSANNSPIMTNFKQADHGRGVLQI